MWRRFGAAVLLLVAGLTLSVLVSRATAHAGSDASSTAVDTTTMSTSTTTTIATSTAETTTTPTIASTTTSASTTNTATAATTSRPRSETPKAPRTAILVSRLQPSNAKCSYVGAVMIVASRRRPIVLVVPSPRGEAPVSRFVYPANGALIAARSVQVAQSCRRGGVEIRSLSLFGGFVTAVGVRLDVRRGQRRARVAVNRLGVGGRLVAAGARRLRLGRWGLLTVPRGGDSALAVRLLRPHAGLAAGTAVRVAFFVPKRPGETARARKSAVKPGRPLKVTPPLGLQHYVFPVAGRATFWDSYGAFRADVSGNWHHGDDIFANVGTPVVAVANGTLNRVGWEPIGGWRLWVRDRRRNEFYYAHLSGYSRQALDSKHVRAGEVLGFVGNTGDAFTTPFHLHFEVHPHQLLALGYDGAVDPTSYLDHWQRMTVAHAPAPSLPATLPPGDLRREARFVFGELLAARGLARHEPSAPPRIRLPGHDVAVRPFTAALAVPSLRHVRHGNSLLLWLLVALAAILLPAAAAVVLDRRRRPARDVSTPVASESG